MDTPDETSPEMSPPSEIGEMPDKPSSWPTGIGVLGIVLASLGLVGGCCGLLTPVFWSTMVDFMNSSGNVPEQQIQAMQAAKPPTGWSVGAGLIGLVLATLLMIGSIKVIRRRAEGVTLCKIWAWVAIPWSVLAFIVNMYIQMQIPQEAQQMGAAGQVAGLAFGACMTLVFGIGIPIFMLAWFSRQKIRDEIAGWADDAGLI